MQKCWSWSQKPWFWRSLVLRWQMGHLDSLSKMNFRMTSPRTIFGKGNGNPFQYSCLKNPMDRGAWWTTVHEVAKSQTWLNDFTFTFYFHALKKEMATHFSVLAWRIPGTGEPGGLPSVESHRVGHDWSDLAAAAARWLRLQRNCFNAGDPGSIPGSGYPGVGNGNPPSILAWRIPRTKEPGGPQSTVSQRVERDWA